MQVPAVYISTPDDPLGPLQRVKVRVHYLFDAIGGQKGTSFHTAEREERKPKIIFLASEVPNPIRGAVVSVDLGESYRVDHSDPHDDETVSADVLPMKAADANMQPLQALYIPTPEVSLEIHDPVIVRVDHCGTVKRIIFRSSEVAAAPLGSIVSIRTGLAYTVGAPIRPNEYAVTQIADTSRLPIP